MLLGERTGVWGGGSGNSIPYITDGLLAFYDAEYNESWGGEHITSATIKNLVGNNSFSDALIGDRDVGGQSNFIVKDANDRWYFSRTITSQILLQKTFRECTMEVVKIPFNNANERYGFVSSSSWGRFLWWDYNNSANLDGTFSGVSYTNTNTTELVSAVCRWSSTGFSHIVNGENVASSNYNLNSTINSGDIFCAAGYYSFAGGWVRASKTYLVRFYDRALTDAELAANYIVDKARFNLT